ncbi:MAG: glycosyltransferase [Candidatus Kapaibacterium sp.]
MDYVTITDHNKIDGVMALKEKYPEKVFTGVESTTYFPEDRCKIHLLIYGFTTEQFEEIQRYRQNIYELREYLKTNNIAAAVAHLAYSVNGKLRPEHVEKLMLLFDVFEVINGNRSKIINDAASDILKALTPDKISELYSKYKIEPSDYEPWRKGIIGGSNDHAGIFLGKSYTLSDSSLLSGFLDDLKNRKTNARGRQNDFTSLAFTVFKVAFDFYKHKGKKLSGLFISELTENIFESKEIGFFGKMKIKSINTAATLTGSDFLTMKGIELYKNLASNSGLTHEERFQLVYDTISSVIDETIKDIFNKMTESMDTLNLAELFSRVSATLPALFLSAPFVTTMNHLYKDREMIKTLRKNFDLQYNDKPKRVLWFSDTITDLNGVSVTLQKLGRLAYARGHEITLAVSLKKDEDKSKLPPNTMFLPAVVDFDAPFYDKYNLKIPSLLQSIKMIYEYDPDEIYLSTPGFVGLTGLLASKLLHVPSVGVFHTDFKLQLDQIVDDDSLHALIDTFVYWFYTTVSKIAVQSDEYINILVNDYHFIKDDIIKVRKGIESEVFHPVDGARGRVLAKYELEDLPTLIFTGRVSKDKNIDILMESYTELAGRGVKINCLIVGDGPYLEELKEKYSGYKQMIFTGKIPWEQLPELYSASDIMIFPSTADTFGMSVLEAQACGVPCLVSDKGGPKDIIVKGETGFVLHPARKEDWVSAILEYCELKLNKPVEFSELREKCRHNAHSRFTWDMVFADILGKGQNAGSADKKNGAFIS